MQDLLAKKVAPLRRRPVVSYWHDTYRVSERCACRDIGLDLPIALNGSAKLTNCRKLTLKVLQEKWTDQLDCCYLLI